VKMRSLPAILNQSIGQPIAAKLPLSKAVAFVAGLGLSMLSYPVHAAPRAAAIPCRGSMPRWRRYRSAPPGPV
jgi:hypothetical protein